MAFNTASDTRLAPKNAKPLGHFMYPHAETAKGTLELVRRAEVPLQHDRAGGEGDRMRVE